MFPRSKSSKKTLQTSPAVLDCLEILPTDKHALNIAYEDTLERIRAQSQGLRETAKRVFFWIIYSERELQKSYLYTLHILLPMDSERQTSLARKTRGTTEPASTPDFACLSQLFFLHHTKIL